MDLLCPRLSGGRQRNVAQYTTRNWIAFPVTHVLLERNEAVIKMIIKGRSPTMRHVSRTYRVALDCLEGSPWAPKIQIKYVDPKSNMLRFSRNEWNHFLCSLNNMCFSTYSGSHLASFLSEDGKRTAFGAMSKRGQDTTSSDGSPMAKPRSTNLVLLSQRKEDSSSQESESPVNPGNEYNRKRVGPATGNCGSSSSNAEVGSSQVYRQGIVNLAAKKLGQKDLSDRKVMKTLLAQVNLMMQYHPKWKT